MTARWPSCLDTVGALLGVALIATDPDAWRFLCADVAGALLGVALAACIRGAARTSRRPDVWTPTERPTRGCTRTSAPARVHTRERGGSW